MKKQGFLKIPRCIFDVQFSTKKYTKKEALIDLFYLANYKDSSIQLRNGEIISVKRGECAWSQEKLAERWKWSRGKVCRFLDILMDRKIIHLKKGSKHNIINILDYDTS